MPEDARTDVVNCACQFVEVAAPFFEKYKTLMPASLAGYFTRLRRLAQTRKESLMPAKSEPKTQEIAEADRPKMMCPHCKKDHPLYQTKTTLGEGAGWRFTTLTIACECGVILAVQLLHSAPIAGGKPS